MHFSKCRRVFLGLGLLCLYSILSSPPAAAQTPPDAPVISPIADRDTTVYNGGARQSQQSFSIVVSNSPTSITATGVPPGVSFSRSGPLGFLWSDELVHGGVNNVTVTASNASGSTSRSFRWVIHPSMMTHIIADKTSYTVGDVVTLTLNYSDPVVVTGSPYIELWPGKNASYLSGSGTTNLRFQATITASDTTHTGLTPNRITAGTGAIATPDGASANLVALASPDRVGGTTRPFDVVIPQSLPSGPTITGITPPPAGLYGMNKGGTITLTVNFNGRVTVTGLPQIGVRIGSTDRVFHVGSVNASGTGVVFFYGSGFGDTSKDDGTLRITGPITFDGGGSIRGADGAAVSLAFTAVDVPSVVFDSTPPAAPLVSGITPAPPTPAQSFVIAGTAEPDSAILFREAGGAVASAGTATADATGKWSKTFPPRPAGTYTFLAVAQDRVFNQSPETSITVTVDSAPSNPVPVVSNAIIAGQVGTAMTPVQISAINNPTSFSAPGLAAYGLTIGASGAISGTPTTVANGATVQVTAANAGGTSAPATITLNIAAAPPPPPPPTTNPPPTTVPPPTITPPPATTPPPRTTPAPVAQTIAFLSPVSVPVMGQPFLLGATASSGLPVTYAVVSGNATIQGNALIVNGPGPVVVRASQAGNETVAPASAEVTITGAVRAAQTVAFAQAVASLESDRPLALGATASSGLPVTFEVVSGPAVIENNALRPTAAVGTVIVRVTQAGSSTVSPAEATQTLTIIPATRLINLSSRLAVGAGDRALIAGFVVQGGAPKRMLVRGIGPGLGAFGVQAAAANPRVRIFDSAGRLVSENDDWTGAEVRAAAARVGAFALGANSRDSALLIELPPGAYTLHLEATGSEGVALAEIYDASDVPALETQQVINLSARGFVGAGEAALSAGFVVTGSAPKRVLVRGIGPTLGTFDVAGTLADPILRLYSGTTVLAENNDWQTAQPSPAAPATAAEISAAATRAGAFALGSGALDAAVLVSLPPGAYVASVSGANGGTGAGLIEVYDVSAMAP